MSDTFDSDDFCDMTPPRHQSTRMLDERTLYARQQDRIAALEAELAERTRERDEAVGWIRVVGEECSSGGDRNTTLAKLRTDQRELAAERKRREAAEALLRSGYTTAELVDHFARYKD